LVVALAEKMVFVRQGKLDFAADLEKLNVAFAQAKGAKDDFDLPLAYGHLVRSMATSRDHELLADLRRGTASTWRAYVDQLVESFSLRIHRGHRADPLRLQDLDDLLRDLDAFAGRLVVASSALSTVATMRPSSHGSAFVVHVPAMAASSLPSALEAQPSAQLQSRSSKGFMGCNSKAYPDIRSIEELVLSAPSSTEIWVNPHLIAWDCAKLPDLVQARLLLMASATTFAEFLASRLPEEPTADHSFMLVQGLRRGCIRLRPDVHAAFAVAPSMVSAPWVASVSSCLTPLFSALSALRLQLGQIQGSRLTVAGDTPRVGKGWRRVAKVARGGPKVAESTWCRKMGSLPA